MEYENDKETNANIYLKKKIYIFYKKGSKYIA